MTRKLSSHQTTSKLSDALREQYESKSKDPTEPPKPIDDILDAASTIRGHRLLGPPDGHPAALGQPRPAGEERRHWKS